MKFPLLTVVPDGLPDRLQACLASFQGKPTSCNNHIYTSYRSCLSGGILTDTDREQGYPRTHEDAVKPALISNHLQTHNADDAGDLWAELGPFVGE